MITILIWVIFIVTAFWLSMIVIAVSQVLPGHRWGYWKDEVKGIFFPIVLPFIIFFASGVYLFGLW